MTGQGEYQMVAKLQRPNGSGQQDVAEVGRYVTEQRLMQRLPSTSHLDSGRSVSENRCLISHPVP